MEGGRAECLLIDNGAGTIKAALASHCEPMLFTNATASVQKSMQSFVSNEMNHMQHASLLTFRRPHERGYLTNCACEAEIWTYVLKELRLSSSVAQLDVVVSDPPLCPETVQNEMNELVYEYFGFRSCLRRPALSFCAQLRKGTALVVDSGFSFTHVAAFVDGKCRRSTLRRINIGGKLMTNYLKELVSYRQWNMMDEFLLMNEVKEQLCYVSMDVRKELSLAKGVSRNQRGLVLRDYNGGPLRRYYVLPDFANVMKGYVMDEGQAPNMANEQVLAMETERVAVPELLFNPLEIGLPQTGIAETAWRSIETDLTLVEQMALLSNVVISGGNAKLPQFKERFEQEFRPFCPSVAPLHVCQFGNPQEAVWQGAKKLVSDLYDANATTKYFISKKEYEERGHYHINARFDSDW